MATLPENVVYDSASAYTWHELNEAPFLERVFAELEALMGDSFSEYTFFVLSSHDPNVRPDSVTAAGARKVLIFISDETSSIPLALEPHYLAIFKSYLPRDVPGSAIFPFNLGYVGDVTAYPVKPLADRAISVFFAGNLNANRLPLYRALHPAYRRLPRATFRVALSLAARGFSGRLMPSDLSNALPGAQLLFTDGFKRGVSPAEYGERLADSRIVLCPRGWYSTETFRHVEAMRAGAVVVSEPLPATHFYRDGPIVTVDDWDTGIDQVRRLLRDESALRELHLATVDWWQKVCSEAATARYVRSKIVGASG